MPKYNGLGDFSAFNYLQHVSSCPPGGRYVTAIYSKRTRFHGGPLPLHNVGHRENRPLKNFDMAGDNITSMLDIMDGSAST